MPLQPGAWEPISGSQRNKLGPGTLRKPGAVVGPNEQPETIQPSRQSNRADGHTLTASGVGDNPRTIEREEISQAANYGTT